MATELMIASVAAGGANAFLAALLVAVYGGVYRRTRASFSLALLLFAAAFLAHNLLLAYAYVTMMPLLPDSLAPYLFGIGVFEAVGLAAMLWTATR